MGKGLLELVELGDIISTSPVDKVKVSQKEVAIIGMALKFPMADNVDSYWENIRNGVNCISDFPEHRSTVMKKYLENGGFRKHKFMSGNLKEINFEKGGYLDEISEFDHVFFRLAPKDARLIDPQQRLFLETSFKAIDDAGYGGDKIKGSRTGVFAGFMRDYVLDYLEYAANTESYIDPEIIITNMSSLIAGRLSYTLDLHGPAMCYDTTCSSALLAVHYAVQSLRTGECDMAIAGGVKLRLLPYNFEHRLGIESSDDFVRTFDNEADGTLWGEGVAAVLLKPLSKAIRDRDNIHAVIKGSTVNQDGSSVGIAAPNALAQEDVVLKAWQDARINPERISYVETHGTATQLGDTIEMEGLMRAFRKYTDKKQFCAVSSVKPNIGHLECASGMAGLIKAVMALKNKEIPPSINFIKPNRNIEFENSPMYVNTRARKWNTDSELALCGVNSFGMSGTNCHMILEEFCK